MNGQGDIQENRRFEAQRDPLFIRPPAVGVPGPMFVVRHQAAGDNLGQLLDRNAMNNFIHLNGEDAGPEDPLLAGLPEEEDHEDDRSSEGFRWWDEFADSDASSGFDSEEDGEGDSEEEDIVAEGEAEEKDNNKEDNEELRWWDEFLDSDSESCSDTEYESEDSDSDETVAKEEEEEPLPRASRKRGRDEEDEDEENSKRPRQDPLPGVSKKRGRDEEDGEERNTKRSRQ